MNSLLGLYVVIMRSIWKGSVSFGLVNIPVALYPAVKKEGVKFRMLRKSDLSPINYKRVAEADGLEVPWDQIGKGYEYEKDRFVLISDEDFKGVASEATQTIQILDFVELREIDPVHFDTPYLLEPQKGGQKAYQLLREVLVETKKIGIARIVIKTKEHLAAIKPNGSALLVQLMHFADDLVSTEELQLPAKEEKLDKRETEMAKMLVQSMSAPWNPKKYKDEYSDAVLEMVESKVKNVGKASGSKPLRKAGSPKITNLLDVLQKSLQEAKGAPRKRKAA
ncbi:MAG: Ku domainn containing protein [Verrucomicrobiales bacterium]|nr:Ku domainn containing protein [Verrucomicrobiales bacterium]